MSDPDFTQFKLGQRLYMVGGTVKPQLVTVEKVGKVWAYFSNGRKAAIGSSNVYAEFGKMPKLYSSREVCEHRAATEKQWVHLRSRISTMTHPPEGVGAEKLAEIFEVLFGLPGKTTAQATP